MPAQRKPDAERVRRNKQPDNEFLPADGPKDVPRWPDEWDALFVEYGAAQAVWERLWREPVAHCWQSWERDPIARYCILTAEFLAGNLGDDKMLGRLQQLEDKHGMNPSARSRLRWLVSSEGKPAERKRRSSVADLKVVGE